MSEDKKRRKRKVSLEEPVQVAEPEVHPPEHDSDAEEDGGFMVKRTPWIFKIEGLSLDIPLTGLKLPTFTTGVIDQGSMTIETVNIPELALNSYFRSWLMKPMSRQVQVKVLHPDGKDVETWSMSAIPAAMGFSDLDVQDDSPWVTQVVFSVTGIRIEPTNSPH